MAADSWIICSWRSLPRRGLTNNVREAQIIRFYLQVSRTFLCPIIQLITGPFDELPRDNRDLSWQNIPGTEDRYEAALSLQFSKKRQFTEGKDGYPVGICFLSFHIKQKIWMNNSKGITIAVHHQVYGPDDNSITGEKGPILLPYNEIQRDSWTVLFVLYIISWFPQADICIALSSCLCRYFFQIPLSKRKKASISSWKLRYFFGLIIILSLI